MKKKEIEKKKEIYKIDEMGKYNYYREILEIKICKSELIVVYFCTYIFLYIGNWRLVVL